MVARINEFASEQRQALAVQVQKFREQPIESMRDVAMTSADGIKSLKAPVQLLLDADALNLLADDGRIEGRLPGPRTGRDARRHP